MLSIHSQKLSTPLAKPKKRPKASPAKMPSPSPSSLAPARPSPSPAKRMICYLLDQLGKDVEDKRLGFSLA